MSDNNISFAKIVANPSTYSWSQVYNAGKLFAVLSLELQEESKEKDYLNVVGKEILDTLEQEFFTLETKDLDSIKEAVAQTSQKIPQDIACSFVVGCFVNNVLYIYIVGNGKVSLKRDGHLGNLLEASDHKSDSLKVASGFLQDGDVVVLQTKQFSDIISASTLSEFLDNLPPSDAAENIAPLVHEKEEPGAASIIISYKTPIEEDALLPFKKDSDEEKEDTKEVDQGKNQEDEEKGQKEAQKSPFYASSINKSSGFSDKLKPLSGLFKLPKGLDLNHPKKVILTIVVVIILVFIGSISFAMKKQEEAKTQSAFNSIYPQASKKYEEGQGLVELNKNLARDSFVKAKQIIDSGKDKLPKGSKEEEQILALLAKVDSALQETSGVTNSEAKQVEASSSPLLQAQIRSQGLYFSEDDKSIYVLTANEVYTLNKEGEDKEAIIENDDSWEQAGGLAPYNGNVYVLDKKQNQILKFVATSNGFSESNYFTGDLPRLSSAISMAIDSSIYVLFTDGGLSKFTRGSDDNFSISGLDKNLSNPTRIFTNADSDNIYILDNGNSRVVVLDKNGAYKSQYQASVIKNAKDLDVSESDKKLYILSSSKVFEIDLK